MKREHCGHEGVCSRFQGNYYQQREDPCICPKCMDDTRLKPAAAIEGEAARVLDELDWIDERLVSNKEGIENFPYKSGIPERERGIIIGILTARELIKKAKLRREHGGRR